MSYAYSHTTDIFRVSHPFLSFTSFNAHTKFDPFELPIQLHGHVVHGYKVVCRVPTVDHVSFHLNIGLGWMMPFQERRNVSTVGHAAVQFHVIGLQVTIVLNQDTSQTRVGSAQRFGAYIVIYTFVRRHAGQLYVTWVMTWDWSTPSLEIRYSQYDFNTHRF